MLIPLRIELLVLFQILDVVTRCCSGRERVALVFGALVVLKNNKKLVHGDSIGWWCVWWWCRLITGTDR